MLHYKKGLGWRYAAYEISAPVQIGGREPDLYLIRLGDFISSGGFYNQQIPPNHALHVIKSGRGIMRMNGHDYEVQAGDALMFFPGIHITYFDFPKSPWQYTWISLTGRLTAESLAAVGITPSSPMLHGGIHAALDSIFNEIRPIYQMKWIHTTFSVSVAWKILDALAQLTPKSALPTVDIAAAAKSIIDNHYMTMYTIDDVARQIDVSRSHLFRCFRQRYKKSPKCYLDDIRINMAKKFLRLSESPIKTIAVLCGYSNEQYFCRAFKKHTGFTPAAWRKH